MSILRYLLPIVVLGGASAATSPAASPPNVVLILADDLGYGDVGCYGQSVVRTPRLDRMAAEGMRFTDFYSGATVCAPARCVLMTGRHTGHAAIRDNHGAPLPDEERTVAEILRAAGYRTALIGKWGLGEVGTTGHPNRQGFDYFFGFLNQRHAHNYYPEFLYRNETAVPVGNVVPPDLEGSPYGLGVASKRVAYSQDLFIEEALEWIEANRSGPFFLYFAPTLPHANNEARRYLGDGTEIPDLGEYADRNWSRQNQGHAAMIARLDHDVGRVLDRLRELELHENTLVIFTSDNGPHVESFHDMEALFDGNGPLQGFKRSLYEGGIRVPTIAWWPGTVPAGTVSGHVGYGADVLVTLAELAGAPVPSEHDGVSFLPTLRGDAAGQQEHPFLYWEFYTRGHGFNQAVRLGPWKAIRERSTSAAIRVYNLDADRGETNDLAGAQPEIVARARELFQTAHTEHPESPAVPGDAILPAK